MISFIIHHIFKHTKQSQYMKTLHGIVVFYGVMLDIMSTILVVCVLCKDM